MSLIVDSPAYIIAYMKPIPLDVRLSRLSRENKRTGCRIWQGMTQQRAEGWQYGMIRIGGKCGGALAPVHRAAWFVANGEWPENKLFNRCGNTLCITPEHWFEIERSTEPDPVGNRRRWLKSRYGLTIEQYEAMLKAQKGRCAICKKKFNTHLSVDHCHKTNKVRALLCKSCNNALGSIQDNLATAKSIVAYLQKHQR